MSVSIAALPRPHEPLSQLLASPVEPRVADNASELRYELWLGNALAGEIRYSLRDDGKLVLVHTEVDPKHKGEGLWKFSSRVRSTTCASAGSTTSWSARSFARTCAGTRRASPAAR